MNLETRLLGTVEYSPEDVISFPDGLPSFEQEHEFLLLPLAGSDDALFYLQSVRTPHLGFILVNPFSFDGSYAPALQEEERKALRAERDQDLCFYAMCVLKKPVEASTINLKCPIALNPDARLGCQVILETDDYHMHHSLAEFSNHEEDAPC